ncbi:hypothetical protein [Mesorhizobium sp.]|nr:hypothetical protein [Mesorhizobium sp.]
MASQAAISTTASCLVVPIDTTQERTAELIGLLRDLAARLSIAG